MGLSTAFQWRIDSQKQNKIAQPFEKRALSARLARLVQKRPEEICCFLL